MRRQTGSNVRERRNRGNWGRGAWVARGCPLAVAFSSVRPSFRWSVVLLVLVLVSACSTTTASSDPSIYSWVYLRNDEPPRVAFACSGKTCRSVDFGFQAWLDAGTGGLFWSDRADLTGDGATEHVRRVREQVVVYSDGAEVWQSPSTWRVADVALGDPNRDGRSEMLLALWKPGLDGLEAPSAEKEEMLRSRPFIVGYRGGIYRTLWGGSAVEHPIHEVELGDVTGDGEQELVVLDGESGHECTISVWRWHGWGFSLVWRSEPGPFQDLRLGDDGAIVVALD